MTISFGCLVAGSASACGKTSLTLGLMRALTRRGLRLATFKSGPDFIDPLWHQAATGHTSRNLDTWMMPQAAIHDCLHANSRQAQAVIVEGAMGLFDGRGGTELGSAAHLAKLCALPVLLVLDASGAGRSLGAVALGFARFDPDIRLAGIVLNKVGSARHAEMAMEGIAQAVPEVPVLGWLPRRDVVRLPSRHLGLTLAAELDAAQASIEALADLVTEHLDLDALAAACRLPPAWLGLDRVPAPAASPAEEICLAVARDDAFCFCYPDLLDALSQAGARLAFFSPLAGQGLPEGADGLYLPGGYPELFAQKLTANSRFFDDVRAHVAAGRPLYAECGGLMSLCRELVDQQGRRFPMAGIVPATTSMHSTRQALGYREMTLAADCLLGAAGTVLRGHEFHYSTLDAAPQGYANIFQTTDANGCARPVEGWVQGSVLASYVHVHPAYSPGLGRSFVAACRRSAAL